MPQIPHVRSGEGGYSCLWGGLLRVAIYIFILLFIFFLPRPPCCFPCSWFPELASPLWMPESKSEYSNCYQLPSRRAWLSPAHSKDPPLQRKPQGAAYIPLTPSYLLLPPRANNGLETWLGRGKTRFASLGSQRSWCAAVTAQDEDVFSDLLHVLVPLSIPSPPSSCTAPFLPPPLQTNRVLCLPLEPQIKEQPAKAQQPYNNKPVSF